LRPPTLLRSRTTLTEQSARQPSGAPAHEPRTRLIFTVVLFAFLLAATACANELVPNGGWSAPIESDGYVYVAGKDGHLVRIDAETGRFDQGFRYPQGDGVGAIYGKPVAANGAVYAAGYNCKGNRCDAQVFAADASTGQSAWAEGNFILDTRLVGGVAANESILVFGTTRLGNVEVPRGYLYALDPTPDAGGAAGEVIGDRLLWRLPVNQEIWSQPVIVDNVAYFGTLAGTIYAVDLANEPMYVNAPESRVLWTFDAESIVNASPVVADGKIYFGDFANNFYALDLATRLQANSGSDIAPATEWKADVEGWVWASALIDGENVYVGTLGSRVYAFNRSNGAELWNQPAKIDGQVIASPTIVQSGSVRTLAVPSSDQDVHLITLIDGANTGRRYSTNNQVMAEPLFVSEPSAAASVIVHSQNGELRRFHPSSLNLLDCFKTEDGGRCN